MVRRGLAKAKGDRFPSILEFGDALDRAIARADPAEPAAGSAAAQPQGAVADATGTLEPAVSTAGGGWAGRPARRGLILAGSAILVSAIGVVLVRFVRGTRKVRGPSAGSRARALASETGRAGHAVRARAAGPGPRFRPRRRFGWRRPTQGRTLP